MFIYLHKKIDYDSNFILVDYVQEDPCKSYPGVCKPKTECFEGALDKINGQWGCPSSPAGIKCCPSNGKQLASYICNCNYLNQLICSK